MPGIDYIIPDVTYLQGKEKNIRGSTHHHAHYDHIGAIPHLMETLGNPPIYMTELTRGIVTKRQEDYKDKARSISILSRRSTGAPRMFQCRILPRQSQLFQMLSVLQFLLLSEQWSIRETSNSTTPRFLTHRQISLRSPGSAAKYPGSHERSRLIPGRLAIPCPNRKSPRPWKRFSKHTQDDSSSLLSQLSSRVSIGCQCRRKYGRKLAVDGIFYKTNVEIARTLGYLQAKKGTSSHL